MIEKEDKLDRLIHIFKLCGFKDMQAMILALFFASGVHELDYIEKRLEERR